MGDEWGWLIVVGFWAVVIGGSVLGDARTKRKEARRKASRPMKQVTTVELAKTCPRCGKNLRGVPLSPEDTNAEPPLRAWRVCFGCGFEEQRAVRPPWTRAEGDAVRTEERRQQERQRIARYFRDHRLQQASTYEGLVGGTPTEFEHAVADILRAHGYQNVYVRGGAGDLAVDIQCLSPDGEKLAVQCKRYTDKPVGSKEMQTFIGMIHQHHGIEAGMYVTTSRYTRPAQDLARRHGIQLIDRYELLKLAEVLQPQDLEADEVIRSLEMWNVVARERNAEADKVIREAELERRRRGREWARVHRRY